MPTEGRPHSLGIKASEDSYAIGRIGTAPMQRLAITPNCTHLGTSTSRIRIHHVQAPVAWLALLLAMRTMLVVDAWSSSHVCLVGRPRSSMQPGPYRQVLGFNLWKLVRGSFVETGDVSQQKGVSLDLEPTFWHLVVSPTRRNVTSRLLLKKTRVTRSIQKR